MIRKTLIIAAGAGLFSLASCQQGNSPNITGKWQATAIEVPSQDSMLQVQMKSQLAQIDSLTKVDSNMARHYGTSDLETIKKMAREEVNKQPEQMKKQMKEASDDFSFELMKDGQAVTFSKMATDTARWYFADEGKKLVLDPFEKKNENPNPMQAQQVMIFDIIHAGSDSLRLRVHQPVGQDVFINLKPSKGEEKKAEEKK